MTANRPQPGKLTQVKQLSQNRQATTLLSPDNDIPTRKMASPTLLTLEEVVLKLYDVEGLKFGSFTMRTGEVTPVYIDMRVMWSYPDIVVSLPMQSPINNYVYVLMLYFYIVS